MANEMAAAFEAAKEKREALKTKKRIAELLKTDVHSLEEFEKAYAKTALKNSESDNLFDINAKQATNMVGKPAIDVATEDIIDRIVAELLAQTESLTAFPDGNYEVSLADEKYSGVPVTNEEINALLKELRPQLTGNLMKIDLDAPSYQAVLGSYAEYLKTPNTPRGKHAYNMFRQGLDILDLDPILYDIIGMNRNSIGHWLPFLCEAIKHQQFFSIPKTKIIKVPITLLQLTRCAYSELTPTTLDIVDRFCQKAFSLDVSKEYFIKTGTYSSKYDFRNCYVHGAEEVKELGEYLLFIHFQALQMASPLSKPMIVGASTTNEWVVREFIPDKENAPTIYKGMPLHTEYRVFVDMDTKQVIGIHPYWDPVVIKHRFGHEADADSPHQTHDYIIFRMYEDTLMARYKESADKVKKHIEEMLPYFLLEGQWSIDVMQNGDDFYIIDMALATNSALVECVPKNLLKPAKENWIPGKPMNNKEIRGFFGQYRFLSNFYEAPIQYEGIQYRNNEAAFQAQKCPERAAEFANLTPSEAKHLGRHVELRHDWENIKDNIMFGVVKAKFSQNANLKQKLLATGNSRLFEENNWGDTCWGTVNGKGENRLGLILEDVRDLLREE